MPGNRLRKGPGERPAIGVIWPQRPDFLVGAELRPHSQVNLDHILQAPEEMIGPFKRLREVATAAGEPRLPWSRGGDAWHLIRLALVRNRVDRVQRRPDQHDVHAIDENQVAGRLRRSGPVGLAVPENDVHRVGPSAYGQATPVEGTHRVGDVPVRDAECGQRPGLRAHITDPDGSRRFRSVGAPTARGKRQGGGGHSSQAQQLPAVQGATAPTVRSGHDRTIRAGRGADAGVRKAARSYRVSAGHTVRSEHGT